MTGPALDAEQLHTSRGRAHVPALDGLRGVAILGVLLFHTGHLPGGFLGVDLFFVLSGYLITDLLVREVRTTGRVALIAFWGKRVRRLAPALLTMVTAVTLLAWAAAPPDLVRTTLADGPWVQADLVNWHLVAESAGYWDRFGQRRVFEHLWSIAVEEQFYAVWPVVVVLVATAARRPGRRPDRSVAVVAALLAAASLVAMIVLVTPGDPTRVYIGTDTRAFSLLLGALVTTLPLRAACAWLARRSPGRVATVMACTTVLLAAAMGVTWAVVDGLDAPWLFKGGLFAHSLLSAALIGLCVHAPSNPVARALTWQPLRRLGRISYSLYLWHWPVIVLLPTLVPWAAAGWASTALVCVVSVGLAVLSTRLVEDPVRFRAVWARGRVGAVVLLVVMLALAAMWVALPGPEAPVIDVSHLR
ncbi:acyltransferase family protein [Actinotalea subterranea]|uniref:acyltransferase family protein n=1 Tax=Actinotalea subterranea TaxID=2607497 RepID=UPI0011EB9FA1|nr:acyltransferase [Actinotalea subterranea]